MPEVGKEEEFLRDYNRLHPRPSLAADIIDDRPSTTQEAEKALERLKNTLKATWHDESPADFPQAYGPNYEPAGPSPLEDLDFLRRELERLTEERDGWKASSVANVNIATEYQLQHIKDREEIERLKEALDSIAYEVTVREQEDNLPDVACAGSSFHLGKVGRIARQALEGTTDQGE